MMWKKYKILFSLVFVLTSLLEVKKCAIDGWKIPEKNDSTAIAHRDLLQIKKQKRLVLLTENSSTAYFIYKGQPMGYEYEMLNAFAQSIGAQLEVQVVRNMDNILQMLDSCQGDVAADNLTITSGRRKDVEFTTPLFTTRQVLIQRKPDNWTKLPATQLESLYVRNPLQLAERQVYVRKGSSFYDRLKDLSNEIGGKIDVIETPGTETTEELIGDVARGKIDFTVADENVAKMVASYYDNLDVGTVLSFPQKIAWAVRKDSPDLLSALNDWIGKQKKTGYCDVVFGKYFIDKKGAYDRQNSQYFSLSGGKISPYDDIIKKYSVKLGWDWKLLASLIFQESQFNPEAKSWSGAFGLMQLLPTTAAHYGIDTMNLSPEASIAGGVAYLREVDGFLAKYVPDKDTRIPFDLASYNVGAGHILDARNLAIKYGLDPGKWDDNVAYFLLNESLPKYYNDPVVQFGYCRGQEPYEYVREILNRYSMYKDQNAYQFAMKK